MIGDDDERGGIRERLVERQQARIDVAVRADERQRRHLSVKLARNLAYGGNSTEIAIGVQHASGQGVATNR